MPATLARTPFAASRSGATGTLTATGTISAGETGVFIHLQNWDTTTAGSGKHAISGVAGGGTWTLRDSFEWNPFGTAWFRYETWGTNPGAATAASTVVLTFTGANIPIVEGVMVYPALGATAYGNVAHNNAAAASNTPPTISLTMQEPNNLMLALLWGDDSSNPMIAPWTGNHTTTMNPGGVSDFYAVAFDNTRTTAGSLTVAGTWTAAANDWQAAAIELRAQDYPGYALKKRRPRKSRSCGKSY